MTVVGADHQAVFTRAADDVRHVVVYLAGDEDVVVFEDIRRKNSAAGAVTDCRFAVNPRHPLRRGFDEAPAKLGKYFWQLAHDHVEAGCDGGNAKLCKATGRRLAVEISVLRITVGDMHGNRQVEIAGGLVKRIKVRIGKMALTFQRSHADGCG